MTAPRAGTQVLDEPPQIPKRQCPTCEKYTEEQLCPDDRTVTLLAEGRRSDPSLVEPGLMIASRYLVEGKIGSGGFALVFKARHTATGQDIAIKVLDSSEGDAADDVRRFIREAQVTSRLRHPNTVRVFDFGQEDSGLLYIAMELLTGRTLWAEMKKRGGAYSEHEAVRIAIAVTQSLSEAHAQGLVHRDLGPRNIFLHEVPGNDPVVKVLDFGLVQGGGRQITRVSQTMGTVSYMSPEQALGERLTLSSDLYSLGVTLYWMVCGEPPFTGPRPHDIMRAHVKDPFPNIRLKARSTLSDTFVRLIQRVTQKSPADRFEDARAMRAALEQCAATVARSNTLVSIRASSEAEPTESVAARETATEPRAQEFMPRAEELPPTMTAEVSERTDAGLMLTSRPEPEILVVPQRRSRRAWIGTGLLAAGSIAIAALAARDRPVELSAHGLGGERSERAAGELSPGRDLAPAAEHENAAAGAAEKAAANTAGAAQRSPEESGDRAQKLRKPRPKKKRDSKPETSTTYLKTKI